LAKRPSSSAIRAAICSWVMPLVLSVIVKILAFLKPHRSYPRQESRRSIGKLMLIP
jgi:hypothetical protein